MKLFLKIVFWCTVVCLYISDLMAQRADMIYFSDKNNSPYSISNPVSYLSARAIARRQSQNIAITTEDLPVNPTYVDSLTAYGLQVLYTSKWMNAAIVRNGSDSILNLVMQLPFVRQTERVKRPAIRKPEPQPDKIMNPLRTSGIKSLNYGISQPQNNMLGVPQMHTMGYMGQGLLIAIFDAGFPGVPSMVVFDSLLARGGIKATYDFVANTSQVYAQHPHGTNVLSIMAGFQPGSLIGPAFQADYILCRTEDAFSEFRIEESNWLVAAEFADSCGADIINTSLGYYTFDNPAMDYSPSDMNGNTTLITRSADIAAAKGMLIVTSAGNNGADPNWRVITAPADGDSVLAIAAVNPDSTRASFSSVGLSSTGRIKPDVAALGTMSVVAFSNGTIGYSSGTSFSGPLIAAMAAGFWQANPSLSSMQVYNYLRNSGHQANAPDSLLGYGIPNFMRAMISAGFEPEKMSTSKPLQLLGNLLRPHEELRFTSESINVGESFTAIITDMTGRVMYHETFTGGMEYSVIPLAGFNISSGHYILTINNSRIKASSRFAVLD